jgi:hypothetical protein
LGMIGVKRCKEGPPAPEELDGAAHATEAAGKRVPLYVGAESHLPYEYAPTVSSCHRAFRLSGTGNGG